MKKFLSLIKLKKEYSIISNILKIKFLEPTLNKDIILFIKSITNCDKIAFNISIDINKRNKKII